MIVSQRNKVSNAPPPWCHRKCARLQQQDDQLLRGLFERQASKGSLSQNYSTYSIKWTENGKQIMEGGLKVRTPPLSRAESRPCYRSISLRQTRSPTRSRRSTATLTEINPVRVLPKKTRKLVRRAVVDEQFVEQLMDVARIIAKLDETEQSYLTWYQATRHTFLPTVAKGKVVALSDGIGSKLVSRRVESEINLVIN
jgi:hypothetical protein